MNRVLLGLTCACLCLSAAASAETTMVRKAGEWEVKTSSGMQAPTTSNICYATDKSVTDVSSPRMPECAEQTVSMSGKTATVDAVCSPPNSGGMKVSLHGTVTAAAEDSYHSEMHMHFDGAPQGVPADMITIVDAKRLGPCQPGEKGL